MCYIKETEHGFRPPLQDAMIESYIIGKLVDIGISRIKKIATGPQFILNSESPKIAEAIDNHQFTIFDWCKINTNKQKINLDKIYIDLDMYLEPIRDRVDTEAKLTQVPVSNLHNYSTRHTVILGHPGAGKTTSLKKMAADLINGSSTISERFILPILIRFRDIHDYSYSDSDSPLFDYLRSLLTLTFSIPNIEYSKDEKNVINSIKRNSVVSFLDTFPFLILLDGFDEITSYDLQKKIFNDINHLCSNLKNCACIITSRTSEILSYPANCEVFELSPLSKNQIDQFSLGWFDKAQEQKGFIDELYQSPYSDTAIRPLTLSHLCLLYQNQKYLPPKPESLYTQIIYLLLSEWDIEKGVSRKSRYANFQHDQKLKFLSAFAYDSTIKYNFSAFNIERIKTVYSGICGGFGLPPAEALEVAREIESYSGIFIQTSRYTFEFAHKSFQEFLTARHLVSLPSIPDVRTIQEHPYEIAIATAMSGNSEEYLWELCSARYYKMWELGFALPFATRLISERPSFGINFKSLYVLCFVYTQVIKNSNKKYSPDVIDLCIQFTKLITSIFEHKSAYDSEKSSYISQIARIYHFNSGDIVATKPTLGYDILSKREKHGFQEYASTIYMPSSLGSRQIG